MADTTKKNLIKDPIQPFTTSLKGAGSGGLIISLFMMVLVFLWSIIYYF